MSRSTQPIGLLLLALLFALTALNGPAVALGHPSEAGPPDSRLLSPASVIDAEGAIELHGVRGSVDLTGWNLMLDADDVPRLVSKTAAVTAPAWSALGTGLNNSVLALAIDGSGNLYAGGFFTTAGGSPANYVAKWDGTTWSALGTGVDSWVYALAVDGSGNLYAGGEFTTAGAASANYIAKWDGTAWSALGAGMDARVLALTTDGSGNLYAGGRFTTAGGTSANYVARWNGTTWFALGSGTNFYVEDWAVDGSGNRYAGGWFTEAGGASADYVARWTGASWSALGSEMDARVRALAIDGSGNLYAGGYFTEAGGASANYIAKWNGTTWSTLGAGMDSNVNALAFDGSGNLYAGGGFTTAGGASANYTAKWDGASWSAVGTGMGGIVFALAIDGSDNIYAGGGFTTAGGASANYVARWGEPLPVELSSLSASTDGRTVVLNWRTASETSNAGFLVEGERGKVIGERWEELGFVDGQGTTSEPQVYSFRTRNLDPGTWNFRLKQIDFDGTFEYSETVEATVTVPDRYVLEAAYPNPFNPSTTIRFAVATEEAVTLTLVDSQGRAVRTLYSGIPATNEMQSVRVDADGLASGSYIVRLTGEGFVATETVTLLR